MLNVLKKKNINQAESNMTDEQSALLSKAVTQKSEWLESENKTTQLKAEYLTTMKELESSMGTEEFNKMMNLGRKMFAPKQD